MVDIATANGKYALMQSKRVENQVKTEHMAVSLGASQARVMTESVDVFETLNDKVQVVW